MKLSQALFGVQGWAVPRVSPVWAGCVQGW